MSEPSATAEKSVREQLHDLFLQMAQRSFATSMDCLCRVNVYDEIIDRLVQGLEIAEDVPEAATQASEDVIAVAQKLRQQYADNALKAWELSAALAGNFRTTVRSVDVEDELIPQYDVEHVAETSKGQVRIGIKTWRRNITVEIVGSDAGVNALNAQMALAALVA